MRRILITAFLALSTSAAQQAPVLAELFTSEGCSSCPPADALLDKLDREPPAGVRLIVLSEHVDYWNYIGWKDPFSSAQFSARQEAYARRMPRGEAYTPQLVLDGRSEFVGSDASAIGPAIVKAAAAPKIAVRIPSAQRTGSEAVVHVQVDPADRSEVWIALADDRDTSQVVRGENTGKTLSHVAVVRSLTNIGKVSKNAPFDKTIRLRLTGSETRVVALVQQPGTGIVTGVEMVRLQQ